MAAEDIYDWGGPKHKDNYFHETAYTVHVVHKLSCE